MPGFSGSGTILKSKDMKHDPKNNPLQATLDFLRAHGFRLTPAELPDKLLHLWLVPESQIREGRYCGPQSPRTPEFRTYYLSMYVLVFTYMEHRPELPAASSIDAIPDFRHRWQEFQHVLRYIACARREGRPLPAVNILNTEQYDTIRRRLGVTEWLFRMLPETVS